MTLAPPPEHVYPTLKILVNAVNRHAMPEGYAVVQKRSKRAQKGQRIVMKATILCDCHGQVKFKGKGRRQTSSRKQACPFRAVAKLDGNYEDPDTGEGRWLLTVANPQHNHQPTGPGAHPVHLEAAMTEEVRQEIEKEYRKGNNASSILTGLRLDLDPEGAVFKRQDIWNQHAKIKASQLQALTPTQALIKALDGDENWYMDHQKRAISKEVEFLFFTTKNALKTFRENAELLIMDCTYKTNRYNMPLLVITGVTSVNSTFYIGFCFKKGESFSDYVWVMEAIKRLYIRESLPYPDVILSDGVKSLAPAITEVHEAGVIKHALCLWHIQKNVLENCKKLFTFNEDFEELLRRWNTVMYSPMEDILEERWHQLYMAYLDINISVAHYLDEEHWPKRRKWAKCFTNKLLHFGNTSTSRSEGAHRILKQRLQMSTGRWPLTSRIEHKS